jgi:hypothetical protein
MAPRTSLLAALLVALSVAGCAPGSTDAPGDVEVTARGADAVPLLAGDEVPPAIAQAAVLHQMLATDATVDLDAVEAVLTVPIETLGGETVGYLAAVAPAGHGGDLVDLAIGAASSGDVRSYVVGARLDRAPLSMADASGEVIRGLGRTIAAIGGRAALARLVAVTSTEILVESTSGALLMSGATEPLSAFELEQLDAIEAERTELADELGSAVRQQLAEQWMPFVHRAPDRRFEVFVDADGDLDLDVARETLAADRILERPAILREPPAPPAEDDPSAKGTSAVSRGEASCVSYFLWQCTEWAYDEVGAYADACITASNPFACSDNASVPAVPHFEDKHPIDGFTYAGCGPESFATMVWQRWHAGERFGFGPGELDDLPSYRSKSSPRTIMHQAAHGANELMGSFPAKDGNIATWPWKYADGANAWLAAHGSSDRIAGDWSLLDANGLRSAIDTRADVLEQLVGRGFGPVIALGGVGDTFGSPHYAPIYRYRVTRNAEGRARAVYATIDWNRELALSDPWQWATGLYWFEADLARAQATR